MYQKPCALIQNGICPLLQVRAVEKCRCPYYTSSPPPKCHICGQTFLKLPIVEINGQWEYVCGNCLIRLGEVETQCSEA